MKMKSIVKQTLIATSNMLVYEHILIVYSTKESNK